MELKELRLKDKSLFNQFLDISRHELSVYNFANVYIWHGLFDIRWSIIKDNLCIFFKDKFGSFLYLSPLGRHLDQEVTREIFEYLNKSNKNRDVSRVENIEAKDTGLYKKLGLEVRFKSYDYLCGRADLANLTGDKFKSKRASCNYFVKHNKFEYLPFSHKHREDCLKLYNRWKKQREDVSPDPIYRGMIDDSLTSLKILLDNYKGLNVSGRIVKIEGLIRAFTFGFKLNSQTFCVLYEITDLSFNGLAQFIFRAFSRELTEYRYVNIMDDSGLENLKKVKLSYRPIRLIPAYIARQS